MWSWEKAEVKPTGRGEEMQLGLDWTGRRGLSGQYGFSFLDSELVHWFHWETLILSALLGICTSMSLQYYQREKCQRCKKEIPRSYISL